MLKIIQDRFQQYVNWELPDVQVGFRKGRRTRDQIANICWIIEKKQENSRRISTSASLTTLKPLTVCIHNNLWNILKDMGIPDHLTCLLKNLYAGQEATVRTGHGTTDCFKIGKRLCQGCILSPCLFNLYAEYILWNTGLDEAQAGNKTGRRNINNLRYADDTTLTDIKWRGTKEPFDESERGEWNSWFKTQHSKHKDHGIGPITSWQVDGKMMEIVTGFIFLGTKITTDGDCIHEIKRCLLFGRKVMTKLNILKSRDITLLTKVHIVKAMVFPVGMYVCEPWTIKKAEHRRIDAFEL